MPAGRYQLAANAFYRAGAIEAAYAAWQQHDASVDNAQLYLGDASTPLQNLYSCEDYTYSPYRYPDDLAAASKALNGNDRYSNTVIYDLPTDQHALRLGIRKRQTVDADWVAYDHFRLRYLGDGTGVKELHTALNTQCSRVYDLAGRYLMEASVKDLHNLPSGVYIIDGKKYVSHK
jgi:hypothetical protein